MSEQAFIMGLAIAAITLVMTARSIAGAIGGRKASAELTQLREELDHQAAALEDAQNAVASQATQLAELNERVDFAERLLAQGRERAALKPGDHQ